MPARIARREAPVRSSAASSRAKYSGLANSSAASSGASSSGAAANPAASPPRHRPGDQGEAEEPAQPRRRRQARQHPHRRRPGGDGDEGQRQPAPPAGWAEPGGDRQRHGQEAGIRRGRAQRRRQHPGAAGLQQHQLPRHAVDEQRGPQRPAQPQPGGRHRRAEGEEAHPHGNAPGRRAPWLRRCEGDEREREDWGERHAGPPSCHARPPAPAAWRGRKARPGPDGKGLSGSRRLRQASPCENHPRASHGRARRIGQIHSRAPARTGFPHALPRRLLAAEAGARDPAVRRLPRHRLRRFPPARTSRPIPTRCRRPSWSSPRIRGRAPRRSSVTSRCRSRSASPACRTWPKCARPACSACRSSRRSSPSPTITSNPCSRC